MGHCRNIRFVDFISQMLYWLTKKIDITLFYFFIKKKRCSCFSSSVHLHPPSSHPVLSLTPIPPRNVSHPPTHSSHSLTPLFSSSIWGEVVYDSFRSCDWSLARCHRSSSCSTSSVSSASCLLASPSLLRMTPYFCLSYHLSHLLSCSSSLSWSPFLLFLLSVSFCC